MNRTSLAIAAALSLAAGASLAQPAPPGPRAPATAEHWRPDPARMAERHAQHLRDALQLRPDQEPALQALMAALRPPAGDRGWRGRGKAGAGRAEARSLTTPQRLDRLQAKLAQRQAQFGRRADAIKRFYAQLSPAQQKALDAMPMMLGHGGHMHGPPGMHARPDGRHGGPPRGR
jgi:hypothetical protein